MCFKPLDLPESSNKGNMKTTAQIRQELKLLIKQKKRTCKTDAEKNKAVNDVKGA